MVELREPSRFRSTLAPLLDAFLCDKRTRGYRYDREEHHLRQLDRHFVAAGLDEKVLSQDFVEQWLSRTVNRRPSTHRQRQNLIRQLAAFFRSRGYSAYSPALGVKVPRAYVTTRVFSREEVRAILQAADQICFNPRSPVRHLAMPTLFHILYGCGLRVGEALRLRVGDIDLQAGILRIRQGKFLRDRMVPVAPGVHRRLQEFAAALGPRAAEDAFFASPRGGPYGYRTIYQTFRALLRVAGIEHKGRGQGPRLHDLRHAFAVHRLESWYRAGEDLNAKLPMLTTYLGHRSMLGTQWYLRLTQALFTDVAARLEVTYGHLLPGRGEV